WTGWLGHRMSLSWQPRALSDLPRSPEDLRRIEAPVLIVKGTRTAPWLGRVADLVADRVPNARLVELPGDHACHLQNPDAGLAAKMDREEAYHRIHARIWEERLRGEPRFREALDELWPAAVAVLADDQRPLLAKRLGRELPAQLDGLERGNHADGWPALW